ncbi:MAG: serine hydrolase domain-containing protein [Bacteroidota bacterium]
MMRRLTFCSLLSLLCSIPILHAQSLSEEVSPELRKQIDAFYGEWTDQDVPGYASAVVHEGKVVYKKVFGREGIGSDRGISATSLFNIGSISHQQLIYGLFLLEESGKLSLDDPLSTYLPMASRFKETIQLKHLLSHASGLYDYRILKPLLGWTAEDDFTQKDLLWIVSQQQALSFTPGTDFAYSLTNIALLVVAMEQASGLPVSEFMRKEVYEPLGMKHSFWVSAHAWPFDQLSKSYRRENDSWREVQVADVSYGRGNVFTSIDDLITWELTVYEAIKRGDSIMDRLGEVIQLPSGRQYNMPEGKLTLGQRYVHAERGIHERYRISSRGGFASSIFSFPDYGFVGIVLHKDGTDYNGYLSMETAYLFLEEEFPEPATTDYSQMDIPQLSLETLAIHEGTYWDPAGELSRKIILSEDTLRYVRSPENASPLIPLGENYFQMKQPWDDKVYIHFFHSEEGSQMTYTIGEAEPVPFYKYDPISYLEEELTSTYAGTYWNEVYGIGFQLVAEKDKLKTVSVKGEELIFTSITPTVFSGNQWFMGSIEFEMDTSSEVRGFSLKNPGIRNLWFEKK